MPDADPDSAEFLRAYAEALSHLKGQPKAGERHVSGTISAGCRAYLASDEFLALAANTRNTRRRIVEKIETDYGRAILAELLPKHIRQDLAKLPPHPANARLKAWRGMCRFWLDAGLIDTDPAREVRRRAEPQSDGHRPWTRDDVAAFRAHWPVGTAQRLAFEVMHRTCASIADACRLGPGMVRDEWLTYRRGKSGSEAAIPMLGGPAWFEPDEQLTRCLEVAPKHMTWITTRSGAARSPKAAGQWFSRACTAAGLPHLSAHGIRKHRAAVFKENGAAPEQRMAILGHETEGETARYSRSAELRRVITGTEVDNSPDQSWQLGRNGS
ncbi:tyrosine-type recombinase/integrase [Salipiger mucosus]|nr:tyrosine-type recombinase/integrase [Salipiger mucosus]